MPITTGTPPLTPIPVVRNRTFPGYGQTSDLGSNWRIKFYDADGLPLSMVSFEVIDFGAIAYKEIFQNVKTILATPQWSAALERLLGVDQSIVDLPIGQAADATIAILDALYFWEPRVEVVDIQFSSDVISGHLVCDLQLRIRNVIFGTDTPYAVNNAFETPTKVDQGLPLPPITPPSPGDGTGVPGPPGETGPPGPSGPQGQQGDRGSLWFNGPNDPIANMSGVKSQDMYLNTTTAAIFAFDGTTWRKVFNGVESKG
jgi:phage baseplate assembly protein W